MFPAILAVIAVALILSGILAGRVSRRITRPLNTLDLEHPLENDAYEELSPLLRRLEHQRRQIDDQLRSLRRRSEEFEQITASMTEGLVLVDNGGTILSMNPAACAVFPVVARKPLAGEDHRLQVRVHYAFPIGFGNGFDGLVCKDSCVVHQDVE